MELDIIPINKVKYMSFFDCVKYIFIFLLLLQIAPPLLSNLKKQYASYLNPKTQVGIIPIKETILDSTLLSKHLTNFFKQLDIKAIVIKMDCGGGAAGACESICRDIRSLKKEYPKPIIVHIQNICASGAYWIASECDYIISPGTAIVGSIGVLFSNLFKLDQFIEQYKISYIPLKAGVYKGVTDPFIPMTPEDKAHLQNALNNTYDQFTENVAHARQLSLKNRKDWADGKIFTALEAKKLKLIDQLGSFQDAIRVIKEKATIEGDIEWIYPPSSVSIFSRLISGSDEQENESLQEKLSCWLKQSIVQLISQGIY